MTSQHGSGSGVLAHFDPERRWCPLDLWGLWLLLLQRTTPELLFVFGSPGDSFACHIFLGPGGKASLCITKKK